MNRSWRYSVAPLLIIGSFLAGRGFAQHSHPNYVVYTLEPFKARIRLKDGTERISQRKAGEAYWNPPITHSVENLGDTPIHNLIIELKSGGSCH